MNIASKSKYQDRRPPENVQLLKLDIARRYAAKRKFTKDQRIALQRVTDLNKLFAHRYGQGCSDYVLPDDDSGRDDCWIMLCHLAQLPVLRLREWLNKHAPWLIGEEREKLIQRALWRPLRFKALTLGRRMGLTEIERRTLKIRVMDLVSKEERATMNRDQKRQREEFRRWSKGAKPRAGSYSRTQPWKAFGISRRTWERRGKPAPLPFVTQIRGEHNLPCVGHEMASAPKAHCASATISGDRDYHGFTVRWIEARARVLGGGIVIRPEVAAWAWQAGQAVIDIRAAA